MTGMQNLCKFQDYSPIDETTANNFAAGTGPGPTGKNCYRLHFGESWRRSAWNCAAIDNMVKSMLDQAREAHMEPILSASTVKALAWDFITQGQSSWRAPKPRIHGSGERLETPQEARARTKQYEAERNRALRSNTRKRLVSLELSAIFLFITHLHRNMSTAPKVSTTSSRIHLSIPK